MESFYVYLKNPQLLSVVVSNCYFQKLGDVDWFEFR